MTDKSGFLLKVEDSNNPGTTGTGECTFLPGLSYDDRPGYEEALQDLCRKINEPLEALLHQFIEWPSLRFGLECALADLQNGGRGVLFDTPFTRGEQPIPINGLVWMGDHDYMLSQIKQKIADGYKVIKLKVGALDFEKELSLLGFIREKHDASEITIRLDANGAFGPNINSTLEKLYRLSEYQIHSIEQPIKAGYPDLMSVLCRESPIPIVLDEELIGHHSLDDMENLLSTIRPRYIILKPSLAGGFTICNQWLKLCAKYGIGYWITSALESNIGLNAIAQYTSSIETHGLAQGLGTGGLFVENFETGLFIKNGMLHTYPKHLIPNPSPQGEGNGNIHLTPNPSPQGEGNGTSLSLRKGGQEGEVKRGEVQAFLSHWNDPSDFIEVKTSGSTGLPKLIRHTKKAMLISAKMTCDFLGLKSGMTALICLSTNNIAGMMMVVRAIERDLKVIAVDPGSHPLKDVDPNTVIDFCAMVPAQVYNSLMVPEEKAKLELIRNLIVGGAPVSYNLQQMIRQLPGNVYSTFGMTETMSHIALRKLNGAGASDDYTLLEGVSIETGSGDGSNEMSNSKEHSTTGKLIIHAPYLSDKPIVSNDLVEITGPRTFKWLGRQDHVINSGGYKTIPELIEERIAPVMFEILIPNSHPGSVALHPATGISNHSTQRYFISSVPDEKLGEIPVLVIEWPGNETSKTAIRTSLAEKLPAILARHEMPREFLFAEKFIETPTHKIIRSAIMKRITG
ncbi:MAG TPA: enolase C-terminal domain-like protein [Lentimicrobium sp.]|nr:enolase C-terminal domain-like protein [Lentimicrobium sp.]